MKTDTPTHTPAPWFFCGDIAATELYIGTDTDTPELVATVRGNNIHANARLIAAAPDLLQSCIDLLDIVDRLHAQTHGLNKSSDWKEQIEARAAISKATQTI